MTWRVFVGRWGDGEPEWTHVDEREDAYERARAALAELLRPFLYDTCPDCQYYGTEALRRLMAIPAGSEFAADVDGEDYLLIRASRRGSLPDDLYDDLAYVY